MTNYRSARGDAARNREAIIEAALRCLAVDQRASMTDIAASAGLGRVTMYGHFSSRDELIEATLMHVIARSEAELAQINLDGEPLDALRRLIDGSWQIVHDFHVLLGVAEAAVSNDEIRAHHGKPLARVEQLIIRGQSEGRMRSDLTAQWLTACFMAVLHEASAQLRAGRMDVADAARTASATVVALVSVPQPERLASR